MNEKIREILNGPEARDIGDAKIREYFDDIKAEVIRLGIKTKDRSFGSVVEELKWRLNNELAPKKD